jgi:deoxyhypusine synthase
MRPPRSVSELCRKIKDDMSFEREVKGPSFNKDITLSEMIKSFETTGFQGSNLYRAIEEIEKMRDSKIFLGCTSNIISSGLRDIVAALVRHKLVHVLVITGGGIEEDLIKAFKPTYCADFNLRGEELRNNGLNRIGNLVIPSQNYEDFEGFLNGVIDELTEGHTEERPRILTPSEFVKILGEKIHDDSSLVCWAARNGIPIYSPAVTDGSIGDILTFHPRRTSLVLDIVEDIYRINSEGFYGRTTGAVVLGAGLVKHHILNANLFRNGLDYCVLINTAQEYDGSDAGAGIEEAISWGKVKPRTTGVKVFGDATVVFPLIAAATFMKWV